MKKILIRATSLSERCEICHQTDKFDPVKNYCSRCQSLDNDALDNNASDHASLNTELVLNIMRSSVIIGLLSGLIIGIIVCRDMLIAFLLGVFGMVGFAVFGLIFGVMVAYFDIAVGLRKSLTSLKDYLSIGLPRRIFSILVPNFAALDIGDQIDEQIEAELSDMLVDTIVRTYLIIGLLTGLILPLFDWQSLSLAMFRLIISLAGGVIIGLLISAIAVLLRIEKVILRIFQWWRRYQQRERKDRLTVISK